MRRGRIGKANVRNDYLLVDVRQEHSQREDGRHGSSDHAEHGQRCLQHLAHVLGRERQDNAQTAVHEHQNLHAVHAFRVGHFSFRQRLKSVKFFVIPGRVVRFLFCDGTIELQRHAVSTVTTCFVWETRNPSRARLKFVTNEKKKLFYNRALEIN